MLAVVLPQPGNAGRRAVLHGDREWLLCLLPLDCLPLEEAINREDAAPSRVGIPEQRQPRDGLSLGIDRLPTAPRIRAPARDQTPFEEIQRPLAGLMVLPDDEKLLARRRVVPPRHVREAAVRHVQTINDGQAKRPGGLNDTSAHASRPHHAVLANLAFHETAQKVRQFRGLMGHVAL